MASATNILKKMPDLEEEQSQAAEPVAQTICRVLLVEDDAANRMVSSELLRIFGYEVDIAKNGAEAVTMFMNQSYPLAVFDLMMEGVDGFEATHCIRELEKINNHKPMQILCLTASAQPRQREICLAAGMNDYLPKPFCVDEFRQKLAALHQQWLAAI